MRLLLIRHGQTPDNVRGAIGTRRPGPGLTDLGRKQADALVPALGNEPIAAVYISPLRRTAETAAPLAAALGVEPVVLEGLEEIEAGDLEDAADMAAIRRYVEVVFGWAGGDLERSLPGSIDGYAFFSRFDAAVARVADAHPDATVALVSHGAAIRVWTASRAINLEVAEPSRRHLENTGIVVLEGSPARGWRVETWEGEPVGGPALEDETARDPLGDPVDEAGA
jgi:probable phosphoglycerate mutase